MPDLRNGKETSVARQGSPLKIRRGGSLRKLPKVNEDFKEPAYTNRHDNGRVTMDHKNNTSVPVIPALLLCVLLLSVMGGSLYAAACGFRFFHENVLVAARPPPPPALSVPFWWREVARALGIGA